jgi:hypothetical protein
MVAASVKGPYLENLELCEQLVHCLLTHNIIFGILQHLLNPHCSLHFPWDPFKKINNIMNMKKI